MGMGKKTSPTKKIPSLINGMSRHDLFAPWEDPEEFATLHDGLKKELFPSGTMEEQTVFDLAQNLWGKRRLVRMRTALLLSDPFMIDIKATNQKSWPGIRRALRKDARQERTLRGKMEAVVAVAFEEFVANGTNAMRELDEEGLQKMLAASELFKNTFLTWLEQVKLLPDAEKAFDAHCSPDAFEKIMRMEAQSDARCTKLLGTLVSLKEFKRTPAGNPVAQLISPRPFDVSKQLSAQH